MNILTPDQRLRVFVSSTLQELADERKAVQAAIEELRLIPVMFELGARPHPPRGLYRTYLEQSHIFVGIYWQHYGWIAPDEDISGLEDEYRLSKRLPKLMYIKTPAPQREQALAALLRRIQSDDQVAYKSFQTSRELKRLIKDDLALLLSERFAASPSTADSTIRETSQHVTPLPLSLSDLIGRENEIADATEILQHPGTRLVTFLGPGGVGKSRLALEVANRLKGSFRDGAYFVRLSNVRDSALVIPAIAEALGLREGNDLPILEQLKRYLFGKQMLLLIDNFEQVSKSAPVLSELVAVAPALQIIVTSRAALRLTGEYIFDVPPLSVPNSQLASVEETRNVEAVRLFVSRAHAVFPSFTLTSKNVAAVADICRRLDGLPLAIELAAAQSRMLSPQTILRRLDKRFELLRDGARDLSARQQTLRNTIDWSYDLLNPIEKELFVSLAVFAGGFSLEAAEAVFSDVTSDVLEPLASLLDNSLLYSVDTAGEVRYFMLESIRQYAIEKLEMSGYSQRVRQRHAEYFLVLAQRAQPNLMGEQQSDWLVQLDRDHDNFRAALTKSANEPETALQMATALFRFWLIRGLFSEGRNAFAQALADKPAQNAIRAQALHAASVLARAQGDYKAARSLLEENLSLAYALDDKHSIADALSGLGVVNQEQHDYKLARSLLEQSLTIRRDLGDTRGALVSLVNLGNTIYQQGDFTSARSLLEEGLSQGRELGDKYVIATVLDSLGVVARAQGDVDRQKSFYKESLTVSRELGDKLGVSLTLCNLGELAVDQNELDSARDYLMEGLRLQLEVQDQRGISFLLDELAHLLAAEGNFKRAAELYGAAEVLREIIQAPLSNAELSQHEQRVALVKQHLDETTFAKSWQLGRNIKPEIMVNWAIYSIHSW